MGSYTIILNTLRRRREEGVLFGKVGGWRAGVLGGAVSSLEPLCATDCSCHH